MTQPPPAARGQLLPRRRGALLEPPAWALAGFLALSAGLIATRAYEPGVAITAWDPALWSFSAGGTVSPGLLLFFAVLGSPAILLGAIGLLRRRLLAPARAALLVAGAVAALGPTLPLTLQFGPIQPSSQTDLDGALNSLPLAALILTAQALLIAGLLPTRAGERSGSAPAS